MLCACQCARGRVHVARWTPRASASVYMCVPVCMHVCAHMCTHLDPFRSSLLPSSSYRGPALLSHQGPLRGDFPPALCMRLVRLPSELWACGDFLILWMGRGRVPRTQPAAWYRVQPHPARSPSKAFYHGPGGPQRQPASPITGHLGACMPGLHPLRTAWTWGTRQGRAAQEHHHTWWAPQPRPLHYRKPQWC